MSRWVAAGRILLTAGLGLALLPGPVAARPSAADFAIHVVAPVDASGRRFAGPVVPGVPFRVRIDLTARGVADTAAVTYDLELPTGIHLAGIHLAPRPLPLRRAQRTSTCLRSCTVGWNTRSGSSLAVFYALVVPGPGDFVLGASLSATSRPDARRGDDRASTAVRAVSPRLSFGVPRLDRGAPRPSTRFAISVPVRSNAGPVQPDAVGCVATAGRSSLPGTGARRPGETVCAWTLPAGVGPTLRVTVTVRARTLRGTGTWLFAVTGASRVSSP